jgi:hypothetical protein
LDQARVRRGQDSSETADTPGYWLREQGVGSSNLPAPINEINHLDILPERWAAQLKKSGPMRFSRVWALLLVPYMLRVTNIKDICVKLAKAGAIRNNWGGGNRKPQDDDLIELIADMT